MTRLHADNIEVERGVLSRVVTGSDPIGPGPTDGDPSAAAVEGPIRFRWNHRWYAVQAVLEHWVEAGSWWQRTGRAGQSSGAVLGIDDGEQEVWRVEAGWRAGASRWSGSMGVYDLRFEWGTGRWSLIRVHD